MASEDGFRLAFRLNEPHGWINMHALMNKCKRFYPLSGNELSSGLDSFSHVDFPDDGGRDESGAVFLASFRRKPESRSLQVL